MENRTLLTLGLIGFAIVLLYRHFSKKDDLQQHMLEEKALRDIGDGVTAVNTAANNTYPLTTIGDTPLAGINYDPFNPLSIAANPKPLELYPGLLNF